MHYETYFDDYHQPSRSYESSSRYTPLSGSQSIGVFDTRCYAATRKSSSNYPKYLNSVNRPLSTTSPSYSSSSSSHYRYATQPSSRVVYPVYRASPSHSSYIDARYGGGAGSHQRSQSIDRYGNGVVESMSSRFERLAVNGSSPTMYERHAYPRSKQHMANTNAAFDPDTESPTMSASPSMPEVGRRSNGEKFDRQLPHRSSQSSQSSSSQSTKSSLSSNSSAVLGGATYLNSTPTLSQLRIRAAESAKTSAKATQSFSGCRGLNNIGNTCFMNSILQCLSHTRALQAYCTHGKRPSSDINNNTTSRMKGALMRAFCDLMEQLWKDQREAVTPSQFKSQIQRFAPRFTGYSQQDAQEFLRYVLQGLHDDVNRVKQGSLKGVKPVDDTLPDEKKATQVWQRYLKLDDSHIVDQFVGQLKSELKCLHCGHISSTFDPFWDLSLPIPTGRGVTTVSLQDCFNALTGEEVLDGDEQPTCEKCKCRRKCTKRFYIHKLPQTLVLHLKRFSGERYRSRLSTMVEFPFDDMELADYCTDGNVSSDSKFRLYGIVNHSGTQTMGHYTAYVRHCKNDDKWHMYDDSRTTVVKDIERTASKSDAYVLFYEQINGVMSRL